MTGHIIRRETRPRYVLHLRCTRIHRLPFLQGRASCSAKRRSFVRHRTNLKSIKHYSPCLKQMRPPINAYAAPTPRAPLEPFSFDPGEIGPEEVEIKVTHCGICHSDLSMLDNAWGMSKYPFVPGHDAVGTVVVLG